MLKILRHVALACLVSTSAPALANTIVVDLAGGGAFTSIQPAVDAAQPGDVILVMQGGYAGFLLTKPLTIIGVGSVLVYNGSATISITNIAANQRAVIANLYTYHLTTVGCSGHVIVVDCFASDASAAQCADIRFQRSSTPGGLNVSQSRVELVRRTDAISFPGFTNDMPQNGRPGVACSGGSRVHLALDDIQGAAGQSSQYWPGSNGGPGLQLTTGDVAILAASHVQGGTEGFGFPHPTQSPCALDGIPGPGIRFISAALVEHSNSSIAGALGYDPNNCNPITAPAIEGVGTVTPITPDDPTLEMTGTPSPGAQVQLILRAPPGSHVRLKLGRNPILIPDPNTQIEELAPATRAVNLGIVPPSGQITLGWNLQSSWTVGTFVVLQADVTLQGGALRRTNSVPIVIR